MVGPKEFPPPPYTGRSRGGGTRKRERTLSARSSDLLHHRTARSRDHSQAKGGGDPPCNRSHDTSFIGGELCALGLIGPMPHLNSLYTWNTHLFSVHARQAHIRPRRSFFAYSALNINLKGVHMTLKIVGLENSVK